MSPFPTPGNPAGDESRIFTIEPYRTEAGWAFDDESVGLIAEPFIGDINQVFDDAALDLPGHPDRMRLRFAGHKFDGFQRVLDHVRADEVEGHWYRDRRTGIEGWLCPAMFCYFHEAPKVIYVEASV
jgi:hypothetical protein